MPALPAVLPDFLRPAYRLPRPDANGGVIPGGLAVKFGGEQAEDVIFARFPVKFGLADRPSCGRMGPVILGTEVIGCCESGSVMTWADARLVLRSALERILETRKIQGQFFEFSSGETLLHWYDHHAGELDIIFLDMELHELDGMETARQLRAADAGLQLAFVTGYADHVFDGYSVGALGYLMKPPRQEQLEAVLDRAQAALVRELDRAYVCRNGDTHYRIPISNILYFASDPAAGPVRHTRADLYLLRQAGRRGGGGGRRVHPHPSAVSGPRRSGGPDRRAASWSCAPGSACR